MNFESLSFDWIALIIGTIGTVLWAHNGNLSKYAAVLWFFSSIFWIAYAYFESQTALGFRDFISVLLYLYGAYRWLINPKKLNQM